MISPVVRCADDGAAAPATAAAKMMTMAHRCSIRVLSGDPLQRNWLAADERVRSKMCTSHRST
jgi:hypothetical protein